MLFGILIIDERTVLKSILKKYCYSSGIGCSYQNYLDTINTGNLIIN